MKSIVAIALGVTFFFQLAHASFDHDHSQWAGVLKEHVTKRGNQSLVNYKKLKRSPSQLNSYLRSLSSVSKSEYRSFNQNQKLAFLINSYNAFTLKLIINNYPLQSIKDIGNFLSGPWDKEFISLLGDKVDLDHIEHGMIRKSFREPRIHFAVNCASIGCPNLSLKPFRAADLNEHLEEMASEFLSDKKKNYYDAKRKRLNLSKIFKWYGGDFDKHHPGGLNSFLAKHLGVNAQQKDIIRRGSASKRSLSYDWSLNTSN